MTTLEITLIIIGVVFLIGSFMVNDKLSHKDLDKIADMSAEELKIITEKEVTAAKLKCLFDDRSEIFVTICG